MRLFGGVRLVNGPSMANVERLDLGAIPMVDSMQSNGLLVDLPHFEALGEVLKSDMERLTEEAKALTGHYTLLSSGDQVADLLFHKLELKVRGKKPKMTDSGKREQVDETALVQLKHLHPVVPVILEFKEVHKLLNTYVEPMPGFVQSDGRIRPAIRTTRASTGRLSMYDPNLMAIPVRSERGKDVRRGFIAPPGWVFVTVDLSQIEMRIMAHHANCAGLIKVYEDSLDVYSDFAVTAFHLPNLAAVDKDAHRTPAKTCMLAVMYDVSPPGLLEAMPVGKGWDEQGCKRLIESFYSKYPEVLRARREDHSRARRYGYVWCMFGRIRHIPEVRSAIHTTRQSGMRQAGNQPLQSGAQGVIKLVMAETMDFITRLGLGEVVRPLLQIHDELLFEVHEAVADEWIAMVGGVVERCCELRVPIGWGGGHAPNWGDLKH